MANSSKLTVMISSRCDTEFPSGSGKKLSEIRKSLKQEIENFEIAGIKIFEVWINEETPPKGGTWDAWDVCINAVKECDILLVLSSGEAGGASGNGDIGICHAEMMTGLYQTPAKVRLIALPNITISNDDEGIRNKRFQDEIKKNNLFRGRTINNEKTLKKCIREALYDAVVNLVRTGLAGMSKGKFHSGAALDWSRLDFRSRQAEMIKTAMDAIAVRSGLPKDGSSSVIILQQKRVLVSVHAIPAALSISSAREMVGQPFLHDHNYAKYLVPGVGGPLHLIFCHKAATETQAIKLLGFPDATIVSPPFGIFVADPIQQVQFAFITNCRDDATVRYGIQRFFDWLVQTGEDENIANRAMKRAVIVNAICSVQDKH